MAGYVKYCDKCRYAMVPTAAFCMRCGAAAASSAERVVVVEKQLKSAEPMSPSLIDKLPRCLQEILSEILAPGEGVDVQLKGAFKEALVCTDRQVIILKAGFMTGHILSSSALQVPHKNITGVQIKKHVVSGYFELSAGGVRNVPVSYWGKGQGNAAKRANCVALNRPDHFRKFQGACNVILSRISGVIAAA